MTYVAAVICLVIFVRLFTYQRQGAQFRRWVSLFAAGVMASAGATVIYILAGDLVIPVQAWPLVTLLGLFAVATLACRGNVAEIIRKR